MFAEPDKQHLFHPPMCALYLTLSLKHFASSSVDAVEQRLRKYRDGCNRVMPLWLKDVQEKPQLT